MSDCDKFSRIPKSFQCGGQRWVVKEVDYIADNTLGECHGGECEIHIADRFDRGRIQDRECSVNTFYHELTHAILQNIGWDELNDDHKFVCSFSALLTEAMKDAYFKTE